jgi:DNA-binding CsgD family transcriptional regulator/PAS domain-containing protein
MNALDEDLARAITEGALEAPPWQSFVRMFRARFAGNYACIFLRRPGQRRSLEVFDAEGLRPDHHAIYFNAFADRDPTRSQTLQPGRVLTVADLCADEGGKQFYDEFLRPVGMADYLMCCVDEPSGFRAGMVVTRAPDSAAFSREDAQALVAIARCFSSGLRVFAALKRAEVDQLVHARATRSLAVGIVLLDSEGRVVEVDEEARRKLDRHPELRIEKDRLRLRDRKLDSELRERVAKLLFQPVGLEMSRMMDVGGEGHLELLLCTVDPGAAFASPAAPRLAVYMSSGAEAAIADTVQLADLFQLTNREAALASLLARGLTLAEAADELGVTEQTARTYSKRIFLKTGVRRQTELVRRILTSVARLSGGDRVSTSEAASPSDEERPSGPPRAQERRAFVPLRQAS